MDRVHPERRLRLFNDRNVQIHNHGILIAANDALERSGGAGAHAFQCRYCTPGQIMSAIALIVEGPVQVRQDRNEPAVLDRD